jgi:hypothetical protein
MIGSRAVARLFLVRARRPRLIPDLGSSQLRGNAHPVPICIVNAHFCALDPHYPNVLEDATSTMRAFPGTSIYPQRRSYCVDPGTILPSGLRMDRSPPHTRPSAPQSSAWRVLTGVAYPSQSIARAWVGLINPPARVHSPFPMACTEGAILAVEELLQGRNIPAAEVRD